MPIEVPKGLKTTKVVMDTSKNPFMKELLKDTQWSHEVIEKLFKENREPYKFNIINPDYNRVSEELIKKLNEFEECK